MTASLALNRRIRSSIDLFISLLSELTFIVLSKPANANESSLTKNIINSLRMIGDTNLFLPDGPKEDVECEIMIAGELYHMMICKIRDAKTRYLQQSPTFAAKGYRKRFYRCCEHKIHLTALCYTLSTLMPHPA